MITLRCTQKLRKYLNITPIARPEPPSAALGDWYANLVPTAAGDLIIFISERSLLTVAIPVDEARPLLELFRLRVINLLAGIGISAPDVAQELVHYSEVQFGKTASRSVLGSLNDFAHIIQYYAEEASSEEKLSFSAMELNLSDIPCKPLGYQDPATVAKALLTWQSTS